MADPITTVFPTTTTTALVSLSSGVAPATHGIVGYRQYLPAYGVVTDMLKFSPTGVARAEVLVGPHWRPSHVSGVPTIFRRGLPAVALSRDKFAGTAFTKLLYDGAPFVPYGTASDLAHELGRLLTQQEPPPVVFTYWDELDTIQHLRGPTDRLFEFELERLAHLMEYVARTLPPRIRRRTTLMVTGDHGQVPATLAARIPIDRLPKVAQEMARPLAGDRRSGLFAARPGRLEALRIALAEALPDGTRILDVPELIHAGFFGPPPHHPELAERLGDLLVLVPSPAALFYRMPGSTRRARFLPGAHGGLEPEELLVPLVRGRFDEFL
jgi:hypothetical protein